jgi:hypothetical protein
MPALPGLPSWRLWENLIFVGAISIGLTNFPQGLRGLPLAIYLFVGYCGVKYGERNVFADVL